MSCWVSTCRAARTFCSRWIRTPSRKTSSIRSNDTRRVLPRCQGAYAGLAIRGDNVEVRITNQSDFANALSRSCASFRSRLAAFWGRAAAQRRSRAGNSVIRLSVPPTWQPLRSASDSRSNSRSRSSAPHQRARHRRAADSASGHRPHSGAGAGIADFDRLKELLGKTAKLDFRMVDVDRARRSGSAGPGASDSDLLMSASAPKVLLRHQEAGAGIGRRSHRRAAGL